MSETCAVCGCTLHRGGGYGKPTVEGRSHATKHHNVAERFFGRTANKPGKSRTPIFTKDPWGLEGHADVYCYECHEELLHNPVLLPADVSRFAELVRLDGLAEDRKPESRDMIGGRIILLQKVIVAGIEAVLAQERSKGTSII